MSVVGIKNLPVDKIFVDAHGELIFTANADHPRGVRQAHRGKKGYQRDPWTRSSWIEKRLPRFDMDLFRPAEVSKRDNNMYAAMDGGGRWVMAQLQGLTSMPCRIHEGLTRQQEAALFSLFDSEVYKLRSIDTFLAQLASGEPMAVSIAEAVKPYTVAPSGAGTLKCVVPLTHMYTAFEPDYDAGLKLIKTTCGIAAVGWSGYSENGKTVGPQIPANFMTALGLVVETAGEHLEKARLQKALGKCPTKLLTQKIAEFNGGSITGIKLPVFAVQAAKYIIKAYNRTLPPHKISIGEIDSGSFYDTMENGQNYAALVREARLRTDDETDEDRDAA